MKDLIIIQLSAENLYNLVQNAVWEILEQTSLVSRPDPEDSSDTPDRLLNIRQAARFLDLHVSTLYGYVQRGKIPVCKRGKRLYFSKRELTEWIKAGRKKPNDD